MNKPKAIILISLLISSYILGTHEVSNVHFEQIGKMINIYYDLSGEGEYEIKVCCSKDGGSSWGLPLINLCREQRQFKIRKPIPTRYKDIRT